jgi:hypothetical protein
MHCSYSFRRKGVAPMGLRSFKEGFWPNYFSLFKRINLHVACSIGIYN